MTASLLLVQAVHLALKFLVGRDAARLAGNLSGTATPSLPIFSKCAQLAQAPVHPSELPIMFLPMDSHDAVILTHFECCLSEATMPSSHSTIMIRTVQVDARLCFLHATDTAQVPTMHSMQSKITLGIHASQDLLA